MAAARHRQGKRDRDHRRRPPAHSGWRVLLRSPLDHGNALRYAMIDFIAVTNAADPPTRSAKAATTSAVNDAICFTAPCQPHRRRGRRDLLADLVPTMAQAEAISPEQDPGRKGGAAPYPQPAGANRQVTRLRYRSRSDVE